MTLFIYVLFTVAGISVSYALKRYLSGPKLGCGGMFLSFVPLIIFGGAHYSIAFKGELPLFYGDMRYMFYDNDFFSVCSFFVVFLYIWLLPSKK